LLQFVYKCVDATVALNLAFIAAFFGTVSAIEGFCSRCATLLLQSIRFWYVILYLVATGLFFEFGILFEVWRVDHGMVIWNSLLLIELVI